MLHHTVNITLTEAELFTIRCGINQAVQMQNMSCIIVITDTIHAAEKVFDFSMYPHQQQLIVISKELRAFFSKHVDNTIEFWDCPDNECVMGRLGHEQFLFSFSFIFCLYRDFVFFLFSFLLDNEEARDIAVT